MSASSRADASPEGVPSADSGERSSHRAQRRAAAEQASRRKQLLILGGAIAAAIVVALVLILLNRPQAAGAPIVVAAALPVSIPVSGQTMGQASAPVTVTEWGDYNCPHCQEFAHTVEPSLISQYVESGKVKFEFRDYPFLGDSATRAAEAASCAADQDGFWQYHDTLYLNQSSANAFTDARLKQIAATLGLNTDQFNRCLENGSTRQTVAQSKQDALKLGVNSTPSIFINGVAVPWQGWDSLKQAIDAALAKQPA
jgi:protein-disulfide isomerase